MSRTVFYCRCGARLVGAERVEHRCPQKSEAVRVLPEFNWRDVWHENCREGDGRPYPMRHLPERLTIEDGSELRLYECVKCGARVFAGTDARRVLTHRAPSALTVALTAGRGTEGRP